MDGLLETGLAILSSLVFVGYKFGQLEKKIEREVYRVKEQLENKIDTVSNDLLVLKSCNIKEEEISNLKNSRLEYTFSQDLKFLKLKINVIEQFLEKKLEYHF